MDARFIEPSWNAPFNAVAELGNVAEGTISGMFPAPLLALASRRGVALHSGRTRYVPFKFYPLREHAELLLESCERLYPKLPMRQALRMMGQYAPQTLLSSTLGRVVLGTAEGAHNVIEAMAKSYAMNIRPGFVTMVDMGPRHAVLALDEISYFLDSHHVGVFEGVLQYAGLKGNVRIDMRDATHADLLLTW